MKEFSDNQGSQPLNIQVRKNSAQVKMFQRQIPLQSNLIYF